MIEVSGGAISAELFESYLYHLIGRFYKILPMKESGCETLPIYVESLRLELTGQRRLISLLNNDARILTLLGVLQYMTENPFDVSTCKREVMRCIEISKALYFSFSGKEWAKHA